MVIVPDGGLHVSARWRYNGVGMALSTIDQGPGRLSRLPAANPPQLDCERMVQMGTERQREIRRRRKRDEEKRKLKAKESAAAAAAAHTHRPAR